MPHVVLIDGYNQIHRARSGFTMGEHAIVYQFFRSLRSLVEQLKPTRMIVVLEGTPRDRLMMFSSYKANRVITPEKEDEHKRFLVQKDEIISMLSYFPVSVVHHPSYEADDVIFTIVKNASEATDFTIVSSDTDFTQMLQEFTNVKLYNPIKKSYVTPPSYDYVTWKALRGDPSDNIPGLHGIGDKKALDLVSNVLLLQEALTSGTLSLDEFTMNVELIKLQQIPESEMRDFKSSTPTVDWDAVKSKFDEYDFKSITRPEYWCKFVKTFECLTQPT